MAKTSMKKNIKKASQKTTKKVNTSALKKNSKPATKKASKKTVQKPSSKKVMIAMTTKVSKEKTTTGVDPFVGKPLDSIQLPMTGGKSFDIKEYAGKKVVLYFYPKDMTPGCTIEGHEFTALVPEFKKLNTVILGISKDSVDKHEKFINKENYKIDLVSDERGTACQWFDVIKEKNMYGKKVMGIERSTFLIGEDGKIQKVWRKVKAEGHAAEVLEFLKLK